MNFKKAIILACLFLSHLAEAKTHRHGFFGTLLTLPATITQGVFSIPAGIAGGVAGSIKHKNPMRFLKGTAYGVAGAGISIARVLYTFPLSVYPRAFNPASIPDAIATGNPRSLIFSYYGGRDNWRRMLQNQGRI
ncbi:MAG: hypothetical protein AB8C84_07940 [Oligoflexales bacterium]